MNIGRWIKEDHDGYTTPGGTPLFVCGGCGGTPHLHGVEYPKRKVVCDNCGRVNIYPWEQAYEETCSLWAKD